MKPAIVVCTPCTVWQQVEDVPLLGTTASPLVSPGLGTGQVDRRHGLWLSLVPALGRRGLGSTATYTLGSWGEGAQSRLSSYCDYLQQCDYLDHCDWSIVTNSVT